MGRKRKCDLEDDESGDVKLPYQRNAANERERDRMRVLSKAFSKLKTTLPWVPSDTKLSKLDTLRLATCYIAHLRQILAEDEGEIMPEPSIPCRTNTQPNVTVHPLNLVCKPSLLYLLEHYSYIIIVIYVIVHSLNLVSYISIS